MCIFGFPKNARKELLLCTARRTRSKLCFLRMLGTLLILSPHSRFPESQINATLKENYSLHKGKNRKQQQILFADLTMAPSLPTTLHCSARSRQHRQQTHFLYF